MALPPVCRVCLTDNLPLSNVKIENLLNIYEKLTNYKYNEVGYPVSMCCICLSVLRKCHKFMETARDSNYVLKQWYNKELKYNMFKARPLYCLTTTTETSEEIDIKNETAIEINQEIKKENIDDADEKEVYIEFERLDNEETNNIQYNLETVHYTNTNVDFDNKSDIKPLTSEVWLEDKPKLKDEAWLEVTPEITTDTTNMLNLPLWMEPGCSKYLQDAAGTSISPKKKRKTKGAKSQPALETSLQTASNNDTSNNISTFHFPSEPEIIIDVGPFSKNNRSKETNYKSVTKRNAKQKKSVKAGKNSKLKTGNKKKKESPATNSTLNTNNNDRRNLDIHCEVCQLKCITKDDLEKHMQLHDNTRPHVCDVCGYRFSCLNILKRHKDSVHKTGKTRNLCDVNTINHDLINNLKIDEKPFSCNVCDYTCSDKLLLNKHMLTHIGEKSLTCGVCNIEFTQISDLNRHMRTHISKKQFVCSICSYKSTEKRNLIIHMRVHTGEKPYSCHICGYRCSHSASLSSHIKSHTGEKPYLCEICSSKFTCKTSLKIHMRSHQGEKPFACEICNQKYTRNERLQLHMRMHTSEKLLKPFSCEYCSYKSSRRDNLRTHMRTHNGDKPYTCTICDYKSAHRVSLKQHLLTRHMNYKQEIVKQYEN